MVVLALELLFYSGTPRFMALAHLRIVLVALLHSFIPAAAEYTDSQMCPRCSKQLRLPSLFLMLPHVQTFEWAYLSNCISIPC